MSLFAVILLASADVPAEVASGAALNATVERLAGRGSPASADPEKPLDRKLLDAINVTRAGEKAGVLPLARPEKLPWPGLIAEEGAKAVRGRWVEAVRRATKEVRAGKLTPAASRELTAAMRALNEHVAGKADEVTIAEYITTKRFLNRLRDDVRLLDRPDAAEVLAAADALAAKRHTVPELVKMMRDKKVVIGPCLPGHEAEYAGLLEALRAFERRTGK